jgi:hypothetical protein
MDPTQLATPDRWLRVFRFLPADQRTRKVTVQRVLLKYEKIILDRAAGTTARFILHDRREVSPLFIKKAACHYLIQIRADQRNILATDTSPLDADFAGSRLSSEDLDAVWKISDEQAFPNLIANGLTATDHTLPSGDSKAGGCFHAWFELRTKLPRLIVR